MTRKRLARPEVAEASRRLRAMGRRIVFTNGCFDLLHVGHVRCLAQAKALGDVLFVGLNSDGSVARLKGASRPLVPQDERAELLAGLRSVDFVTPFEEDDPGALIAQIVPHVLVKGGDWTADRIVGRETVEAAGGRVVSLPVVPGRSTTDLLRRAAGPAAEPQG